MAIVEAEALVLRSLRYGDTSRIATLLTPQFGKVHVIAKGARDPKSPFGGALEPLTRTEIVFYLKKHRTLHLLKSALVAEIYERILLHPATYCLASAALEFVERILPDEDPFPPIYAALLRFLEGAQAAPENPRAEFRFKAFQLHTVALLGYAPQLEVCAHCGRSVGHPCGFAVAEGGMLCGRCDYRGEQLALSPDALKLLRRIVAGARTQAPQPAPERVSQQVGAGDREAAAIIEALLRFHVTGYRGLRALRSLAEWRSLGAQ